MSVRGRSRRSRKYRSGRQERLRRDPSREGGVENTVPGSTFQKKEVPALTRTAARLPGCCRQDWEASLDWSVKRPFTDLRRSRPWTVAEGQEGF